MILSHNTLRPLAIGVLAWALVALVACSGTTVTITPTASATATGPTATPVPVVALFSVFSAQVTVPQHGTGTATATCPTGAVLLSGGYAATPNLATDHIGVAADASYPAGGNSWTATIRQTPYNGSITLVAAANCLQTTFTVTTTIVQAAHTGSPDDVTATCDASSTLTGGGFLLGVGAGTGFAIIEGAEPDLANGFHVVSRPVGLGEDGIATAYAVCAHGNLHAASIAAAAQSIPTDTRQTIIAHCPAGQLPVGGGHSATQFATEGGVLVTSNLEKNGMSGAGGHTFPIQGWEINGYNEFVAPNSMTVSVICVTVA